MALRFAVKAVPKGFVDPGSSASVAYDDSSRASRSLRVDLRCPGVIIGRAEDQRERELSCQISRAAQVAADAPFHANQPIEASMVCLNDN